MRRFAVLTCVVLACINVVVADTLNDDERMVFSINSDGLVNQESQRLMRKRRPEDMLNPLRPDDDSELEIVVDAEGNTQQADLRLAEDSPNGFCCHYSPASFGVLWCDNCRSQASASNWCGQSEAKCNGCNRPQNPAIWCPTGSPSPPTPTNPPTNPPTPTPPNPPAPTPTCDPTCADARSDCNYHNTQWAMCTGGTYGGARPQYWTSACRATCQVCILCPGPTPSPVSPTSQPSPAPSPVSPTPQPPSPAPSPPAPTPPLPTTGCPIPQSALATQTLIPSSFTSGCQDFVTSSSGSSCSQGLCGQCKNPGSKFVLEKVTQSFLGFSHWTQFVRTATQSTQAGYFVPTDITSTGNPANYAYMCMDWTFGSSRMTSAQNAYNTESGDNVYFGVGTDGCSQTSNMGGCYRITYGEAGYGSAAQSKDLIVQAVNSGGDVHCPQFDLQVGVGGQGIHNNCVGGSAAMFSGSQADMGERYGGWRNRADCAKSPRHLRNNARMQGQGDDMVQLCELSFDSKLRGENGLNSRIIKMSQVTCPSQLTALTGFRRADQDNFGFHHNQIGIHVDNPNDDCGFNTANPEDHGKNCLSRMMDCRKPSGSFKDNVDVSDMCPGMKILPACMADGYTRITSDCGMDNCWS